MEDIRPTRASHQSGIHTAEGNEPRELAEPREQPSSSSVNQSGSDSRERLSQSSVGETDLLLDELLTEAIAVRYLAPEILRQLSGTFADSDLRVQRRIEDTLCRLLRQREWTFVTRGGLRVRVAINLRRLAEEVPNTPPCDRDPPSV